MSKTIEDIAWTKTYMYMFPALGSKETNFVNVENAFLEDEDYPNYDDSIFVLFRETRSSEYKEFVDNLKKQDNHNFSYLIADKYRVSCMEIPDQFKEDFEKFKDSRYSEMSEKFKDHILNFYKKDSSSLLHKILYKSSEYRHQLEKDLNVSIPKDNELISVLNMETETLTKKLKEYEEQRNIA